MEFPELVPVQADIQRCNRCGFCQAACPVYRVTGHEGRAARGRYAHLKSVLAGDIPLDRELSESLSDCLLCRACTEQCPPKIRADRVMPRARAAYADQLGRSAIQRFVFRRALHNPAMLASLARLAIVAERLGLARLSSWLGRLPGLSPGLTAAPALLEEARGAFLRRRLRNRQPTTGSRRATYFVGCGINYALPAAGEATITLLEKAGFGVTVAENVCCGLPAYAYGDLEAARELARRNLGALEGADLVVTDCASCSSFLKDYPHLFDGEEAERAALFAARVRDLTEVLVPDESMEQRDSEGVATIRVTYHDPCHLSRYQDLREEPRALLRSLPGVDFAELPEADWCCGGAGTYLLSHYELSRRILDRKVDNIVSTGADVVVTACPACVLQISYGLRQRRLPIRAVHLAEFIAGRGSSRAEDRAGAEKP